MSYTEMYVIDGDGDVVHHAEFQNSHGGAAAVWSLLCVHYLGVSAYEWCDDETANRLFALANDPSSAMDLDDRIVLLSTDEDVMVRSADVPRLADCFERFYVKWAPKRVGMVFSIGEQAVAMREAVEDPSVQGICWNQTSVGESWREPMPRHLDDDGVTGDGIDAEPDGDEDDCDWGYNINVHRKHWWLFEHPAVRHLTEGSAEARV